jgi:hypothetical protein
VSDAPLNGYGRIAVRLLGREGRLFGNNDIERNSPVAARRGAAREEAATRGVPNVNGHRGKAPRRGLYVEEARGVSVGRREFAK